MPKTPTIEVLNLIGRRHEQRRAIYTALMRMWWPHPVHGAMYMVLLSAVVEFRCTCGDTLVLTHDQARDLSLI